MSARTIRRTLAVAALSAGLLVGGAAPALAAADSCSWLHGDEYCRTHQEPLPETTYVGPAPQPRECRATTKPDRDTYGVCGWVDDQGRRWV